MTAARIVGAIALLLGFGGQAARPHVVHPGEDLGSLPQGAVVRLAPGIHGPLEVGVPGLTVLGGPGTVVRGPILVTGDGVRLAGLQVRGGESGVSIRRAVDVEVTDVEVRGAELHGIEVVAAAADITGCRVAAMESTYAQGIEVRNTTGLPRTAIESCTIEGGQEGLVTHSARVELRDNVVTGTTMRGIAVTEMSEGLVEDNVVFGATGIGVYCGDMSHCEVRDNTVRDIRADHGGARSAGGYGVVGWYHSTLRLSGNRLDVEALEPVRLTLGSVETERFPLSLWAKGWGGVTPGLPVAALSLVGLAAVTAVAGMRLRAGSGTWREPTTFALAVLAAGLAVQTFHLFEHVVQVTQVHAIASEQRSGIAGAVADIEVVHFFYNAAVLAFLVWAWGVVKNSRVVGATLPWFFGALVIQAYHLVEHTTKMIQHVGSGIQPAPGLIGGRLGLVWFHFGINLAVYVGMAPAIVALLRAGRRRTEPSAASA